MPFVRDANEGIKLLLELDSQIPENQPWVSMTDDAFAFRVKRASTVSHVNKLFWTDVSCNCAAFATMAVWRGAELLRPAIRAINQKEFVAGAVLSRSMLELASAFILHANTWHSSVRELVKLDPKDPIVSPEIESFVTKAIWGRRFSEPEKHIEQTNCLTFINRLSRNPNCPDLTPVYSFLCEVAHPNVVGYARYWADETEKTNGGIEYRMMSKTIRASTVTEIIEKSLWALAFSSACINNGYALFSEANANATEWLATS